MNLWRDGAWVLAAAGAAVGVRALLPCSSCVDSLPPLALATPAAPGGAPEAPPERRSVKDFKPSVHGFHFRNNFSGSPLPSGLGFLSSLVNTPSQFGLCGGMSAAAADFFLAGREPPDLVTPPKQGEPLYEYLWTRQADSLGANFSMVPVYSKWMGKREEGPFGTQHLTAVSLPILKDRLANGRPLVLGLVLTSSARGEKIWDNHQVLALGATTNGPTTIIRLYDSNHPFNDDVKLTVKTVYSGSLPLGGPLGIAIPILAAKTTFSAKPTAARPNGVTMNVRGFFEMPYEPVIPPVTLK